MPSDSFQERYESLKAEHPPTEDKVGFIAGLTDLHTDASRCGDEPWTLFFAARIASEDNRREQELELLERLLAIADGRDQLLDTPPFLWAPLNKGIVLRQLGRKDEAIAVYEEVVRRIGTRQELPLIQRVAMALVNKGFVLGELGRKDEAIAVYEEVVRRIGTRQELPLIERVAKALVNKGISLGELGRKDDEIAVYEEVVTQFGTRQKLVLIEQVATALVNKGFVLGELGRKDDAIAVYEEVVTRIGTRQELPLIEKVVTALVNKGVALSELGRKDDAIAVYEEVVTRIGTRQELPLIEKVARALVNKGFVLRQLGRLDDAIAIYDDLLTRLGTREEFPLLEFIVRALVGRARTLEAQNQFDEALACWERIIAVTEAEQSNPWRGLALVGKSRILARLNRTSDAAEALEQAQKQSPGSAAVRQAEPFSNHHDLVRRIEELLGQGVAENCNTFRAELQKRKQNTTDFLRPESRFDPAKSVLLVLREWNSYTPIIPSEQEADRGGGYFLFHQGKGIVIDPGYDFIENFYNAGGRIHDIDAVVITHAHDDHTADFEALMTLLHQYNEGVTNNKRSLRKVSLYLSIGAERKLSGFFRLREDNRVARTVVMNRCEGCQVQQFELFDGVKLTVLPAYHDDLMTSDSSVGLCFDLSSGNDARRVVFTGDTGLYPKDLDNNGKPKKSDPDTTGKTWALLDTQKSGNALHERYCALLSKLDGNEEKRIDLLVPHLGSIQEYELDRPSSEPDKVLLYANHLGLRGLAILLSETRPRAAIVSEFGSELKDIKRQFIRVLQAALTPSEELQAEPYIIPGDLTIAYDIDSGQFLCHTTQTFLPPSQLSICEDTDQSSPNRRESRKRTYLLQSGAKLDGRDMALKRYHEAVEKRTLPYFKRGGP